jgi:hypothetical protein
MRRLLYALIATLLLVGNASAYSTTPNHSLKLPVNGVETGWGTMLNDNTTSLDNAAYSNGSGVANRFSLFSGCCSLVPSTFSSSDVVLLTATQSLSGKTFDTAVNTFKINGVTITGIGGTTGTLASLTGAFTLGHIVTVGASGNFVDGGPAPSGTTLPFNDNVALLQNFVDPTKKAILDLSLLTTATTRIYKLPDFNADTFTLLAAAQTLLNKTFEVTANVFKVTGITISSLSGNTGKLVTQSSSVTTGNFYMADASGNAVDSSVNVALLAVLSSANVFTNTQTIANQNELRFREATPNGTNYVGLKAPATLAANTTYILPATDGTTGAPLITNGSGTLAFATPTPTQTPGPTPTPSGGFSIPMSTSGTIPNTANYNGIDLEVITSAGTANNLKGLSLLFDGAATGSWSTGLAVENDTLNTGTNLGLSGGYPLGAVGVQGAAFSGAAGNSVGVDGEASSGDAYNVGVYGFAQGGLQPGSNTGTAIGVLGAATGSNESSDFKNVAGYFSIYTAPVTGKNISAALVAIGSASDPIAVFYDGSVEKVRINDGGSLQLKGQNEIRFYDSDSSNYVGFQARATISSDIIWAWPNTDSTGTQCLSSDGAGTLGWSTCSGGSLPVSDATSIVTGSSDATKLMRFEVDGFTTATTRVLTPPNANITIAGQDFANLFTAAQTLQAQNEMRFADADSSNYVGFKAGTTVTANKIWTLPLTDSTGTQCLASDGSLTLSWVACSGGGGITGTLTSGRIPVASGASTVVDTANFTFDATNFRQRIQNATTATDNSLNMWQLSGSLPSSPSASVYGAFAEITSTGSAAQAQLAQVATLLSGYTGSSSTLAVFGNNQAAGTGATLNLASSTGAVGNIGVSGSATAAGAGNTYAVLGNAGGSTGSAIGGYFKSGAAVAGNNIGVLGSAGSSTEATDLKNVGVYGTLNTSLLTGVNGSFAGLFDSGTLPNASSQVIRAQGTLPASPASGAIGIAYFITSAGSASQFQIAENASLNAGYTGSSATYAFAGDNAALGTGTNLQLNSSGSDPSVNVGTRGYALGAGTGTKVGIAGFGTDSSGTNVGGYGRATGTAAGTNIGMLGNAANSTEGTDLKNVAGYFTLHSALVTASNISAALIADGAGSDILRGYNAATLKARMGPNGEMYIGEFAVSGLPTCGSTVKGMRATINDANAACTFASTPTGGASTVCPVYCDGSAWKEG